MTPHKSIKCSPRGPALISAGNILHGVGWEFQAAKHSAWGERLSWRVGKQCRGACSSQASWLHSSRSLSRRGGDQFPRGCAPQLCLPLPQWREEEARRRGRALSLRTSCLSSRQRSAPTTASYRASQFPEFALALLQLYSKSEKNE